MQSPRNRHVLDERSAHVASPALHDAPVNPPALRSASPDDQVLLEWLDRAAWRSQIHEGLRGAGWVACVLLAVFGVYQFGRVLHVPDAVLLALAPLLILGSTAMIAWLVWRYARRANAATAAAEADARGGLKDEMTSAYWFARQPARSAWESLMLGRAAQTIGRLDARALFPLRLPSSFAVASVLAVTVAALSSSVHDAAVPVGFGTALAGDHNADARGASGAEGARSETGSAFDAKAGSSAQPETRHAAELWARAEALALSLKSPEQQAELQRAIQAHDAGKVQELLDLAQPEAASAQVGSDARALAGQVAADAAQNILERLQSLLTGGSQPKTADTPSAGQLEVAETGSSGDAARATERREADPHTTMDALNDALRALAQAATGDHAMGNSSPPGQAPETNAQANINGGAAGMRVNTSQAGEGGEDTPPDAPSESLGEPVIGKATARLAAQLQHVDSAATQGELKALGNEGGYAATQAQTARVGLTAAELTAQRADAAVSRAPIPIAYRASVKRYFLTEHGKEY